jgi:hypothetical protein
MKRQIAIQSHASQPENPGSANCGRSVLNPNKPQTAEERRLWQAACLLADIGRRAEKVGGNNHDFYNRQRSTFIW